MSFTFEELSATRINSAPATGGVAGSAGQPARLESTSDGLTMTIQKVQNKTTPGNYTAAQIFNFDVRSFALSPAGWGGRSLDPTFNSAADPNDDDTWWLATFSEAISSISLETTDFAPYADTMRILAFAGPSASGSQVATATPVCFGTALDCPGRPAGASGDSPDFGTISLVTDGAFLSVLFRAEDRLTKNGNMIDNINVTRANETCDPEFDECPPVPEPAAFVLTGFSVGAAALSAALRKRS